MRQNRARRWREPNYIAQVPALTFVSLSDDVVVFRRWSEADVAQQLAAFGDVVFETHSDWAPRSEVDARQRLINREQARLRGELIDFALVDSIDLSVVLGGASLNDVDLRNSRASLGYWLAPAARGRGVATHAVRLLARWAFRALPLARLEITCGPDNHGSQRVAERCGFSREGVLRSHVSFRGGRRDSVMFSLLPGELT